MDLVCIEDQQEVLNVMLNPPSASESLPQEVKFSFRLKKSDKDLQFSGFLGA